MSRVYIDVLETAKELMDEQMKEVPQKHQSYSWKKSYHELLISKTHFVVLAHYCVFKKEGEKGYRYELADTTLRFKTNKMSDAERQYIQNNLDVNLTDY